MGTPLRLLQIEDNEDDASFIARELQRGGYDLTWERVDTAAALAAAVQRQPWDVITCDWVMPRFSAPAALDVLRAHHVDAPVIIVSGEVGEEVAISAMKAGAHDVVSKHRLARLRPAVERELREAEGRRERRRAEAALREREAELHRVLRDSEQHFRALIENSLDLVAIADTDGLLRYVSPSHELVSGFNLAELVGRNAFDFVHPDDVPGLLQTLTEGIEHGRTTGTAEYRFRHKDGSWRYVEGAARNLMDDPVIKGILVNSRDITERKRAEESVRRLNAELEEQVRALRRSEHRFATVFRASPAAIGMSTLNDGRLIDVNQRCADLLGYRRDELVGHTVAELGVWVEPADRTRATETLRAVGSVRGTEAQLRRKSGEIRDALVSMEVIELPGETEPVLLVMLTDITERKRAAQQIVLQGTALAAAANAIVITDRDGQIIWTNPAFTRLTGYAPDEVLGQTPRILKSGAQDPAFYEMLWATLLSGQVWSGEVINRRKDGSLYTEEMTVTPVRQSAAITHFIAVKQDVTERKHAEAEIRAWNVELERRVAERTAALERLNRELEAFSYSVSHDLRAPLRAVEGFGQALREDCEQTLDDRGRHYLDRIQAGARRMEQLIDDLLGLSRVTRREVTWEAVNLSELAGAVAEELQKSPPARQVEFVIAPGLVAQGDAHLLRLVLENLLGNAWKYTGRHRHARIEFAACAADGAPPAYFVRDDGAGFDMTQVGRLFGAFQRLHSESAFEGSGIGLATVQRIIHRHGGQVWAEGAVERGATFYFTLGGSAS